MRNLVADVCGKLHVLTAAFIIGIGRGGGGGWGGSIF